MNSLLLPGWWGQKNGSFPDISPGGRGLCLCLPLAGEEDRNIVFLPLVEDLIVFLPGRWEDNIFFSPAEEENNTSPAWWGGG